MTKFLSLFLAALGLLVGISAQGGITVTLAWDEPLDGSGQVPQDLVGYRLYWGQAYRSYDHSSEQITDTSHTVSNLMIGPTYHFAVTAVYEGGEESGFSVDVPWASMASAPLIDPAGGTFDSFVNVTLSSATPGAQIYFTTNGITPTTNSTPYVEPIILFSDRTVLAIAAKAGIANSPVVTNEYTVLQDTTPPQLASATAIGDPRRVTIGFSEPVDETTAESVANYTITPAVSISSAQLQPSLDTVTLVTSTLETNTTYTVTVENIKDRSPFANVIPQGSFATFEYLESTRATDGLIALYTFDEGGGTTVRDVSGRGDPLDLDIGDIGKVTWLPGALCLDSSTKVSSPGAATKIHDACTATEEITIELWVKPSNIAQDGPARIAAMSRSPTTPQNFLVGAGRWGNDPKDVVEVRLKTSVGVQNTTSPEGSLEVALKHLTITRDASGNTRTYVDGSPTVEEVMDGSFAAWDPAYPFVLGNEPTGDRPWLGEYHLVAVYDRALSAAEVDQNYQAGPEIKAGGGNNPPVFVADFFQVGATGAGPVGLGLVANDTLDPLYGGYVRYLTIEYCEDLSIEDWSVLPGYASIPAQGQVIEMPLSQGGVQRYYRVRAELE